MSLNDAKRLEYIEDFYKSGLIVSHFCKARQLKPQTFYGWLKKFGSYREIPLKDPLNEPSLSAVPFIPIKVSEDDKSVSTLPLIPKTVALSFITKNFCLEFSLNMQENMSDFKGILQALHDLT